MGRLPYDSSFWVDIVVPRFVDLLPLDHQEKRFRCSSVNIPMSTMARGLIPMLKPRSGKTHIGHQQDDRLAVLLSKGIVAPSETDKTP
jgi:hypothetical protein